MTASGVAMKQERPKSVSVRSESGAGVFSRKFSGFRSLRCEDGEGDDDEVDDAVGVGGVGGVGWGWGVGVK